MTAAVLSRGTAFAYVMDEKLRGDKDVSPTYGGEWLQPLDIEVLPAGGVAPAEDHLGWQPADLMVDSCARRVADREGLVDSDPLGGQ